MQTYQRGGGALGEKVTTKMRNSDFLCLFVFLCSSPRNTLFSLQLFGCARFVVARRVMGVAHAHHGGFSAAVTQRQSRSSILFQPLVYKSLCPSYFFFFFFFSLSYFNKGGAAPLQMFTCIHLIFKPAIAVWPGVLIARCQCKHVKRVEFCT